MVFCVLCRLCDELYDCACIVGLQTTQPTHGGAVTAVWKTDVQIVSTPPVPSTGGPIVRFWTSRRCGPTGCLVLLLIKAGDVFYIVASCQTASHAERSIGECHRMHTRHICMTKHSYFPYTSTYIHIFPQTLTVTTTDIKTIMHHIHASTVSRHLAIRSNNNILHTPPPHIISSEKIHPRLTRRIFVQLRTNKSPFLKSYLHKVDAKSHPSPSLFLHCNTRRSWLVDHKQEDRTPSTRKG